MEMRPEVAWDQDIESRPKMKKMIAKEVSSKYAELREFVRSEQSDILNLRGEKYDARIK